MYLLIFTEALNVLMQVFFSCGVRQQLRCGSFFFRQIPLEQLVISELTLVQLSAPAVQIFFVLLLVNIQRQTAAG